MDVFEQAFAELNIEAHFDETGTFSCTYERSGGTTDEESMLFLAAYQDTQNMTLRLSVTTHNEIPNNLSADFFRYFSEKAIEPFRGGVGAGVLPGENNVTVYQSIKASDLLEGSLLETVESLMEEAEEWDQQLIYYSQLDSNSGDKTVDNASLTPPQRSFFELDRKA
ncbi:hypothetical protein M9194_14820 [Vibrio sp. S4M6]|uniref:hypothetical protein n=1 Tax=Vibrio sinus TaxID=2946865 RepID=UPI002029CBA0|nr:hypothetical protein [Vibrio sinus]MCL9782706.1 hypothetical protein [Vibrio sinus]